MKKCYPYQWWRYLNILWGKNPMIVSLSMLTPFYLFGWSVANAIFGFEGYMIAVVFSFLVSMALFYLLYLELKRVRNFHLSGLKVRAHMRRYSKIRDKMLHEGVCEVIKI